MRVARIGLAPVKGTRHQTLPSVMLTRAGPVGDRRFCLIDATGAQALRTVGNPSLVAVSARWDGHTLTVHAGDRRLSGRPEVTGPAQVVDYWGRQVRTEAVSGEWSAFFSEYLCRPVVLTAVGPAAVVYGACVSLVTTASLRALAPEVRGPRRTQGSAGTPVDSARFRSTFVVDAAGSDQDRPGAEASWVGRELHLGSATIRVTAVVARCAVVDLDPQTGRSDLRLLTALPRDGRGQPVFGVEAEVVQPGLVVSGSPVRLSSGGLPRALP